MTKKVEQKEIESNGDKIVLPKGMGYDEAIAQLDRQKKYEEEYVEIISKLNGAPWDGGIALQKAIKQMFGWCTAETQKSFFGDKPPRLVDVDISPTEQVAVPLGQFKLPGITGEFETGATTYKGKMVFAIRATVKRKHEKKIKELMDLAKKILQSESIYKSKAVKIRFKDDRGNRFELPTPSFLDLSGVKEKEILFSSDVESAITTSLYTPIEKAATCRAHQVPLKRGILLAGPYGTGKTLLAYVAASKCTQSGWTFLYCERADELEEMVKFAHDYQPAVVFCEDIDRVVSGDRSVEMDDILNIVDGIESKKTEIMVILTTNHVEKINQAMLRPGRLDAIINVQPPDAPTVEKLIRLYGRDLVRPNENLSTVGRMLAGKIPAIIRECVERAKLSAIKNQFTDEKLVITAEELEESAKGMRLQLELLEGKSKVSDQDRIGQVVGKWVSSQVIPHLNGNKATVSE